jgi:hypothetical protein
MPLRQIHSTSAAIRRRPIQEDLRPETPADFQSSSPAKEFPHMSTSAILPISSIDFGSSSATASQQSVFNGLLSQLQQAIGSGDLTSSQTLLNAIDALSPSSPTGSTPLGTFLTSVGSALNDGRVAEAQSALATY